ncbi:MAG TPA: hypothetical protein VI564_06980 [Candidatus Nanoarchaeia archaeon]|nr:hypothetical protein [Candidatus Nanoarchaeia archaeon]
MWFTKKSQLFLDIGCGKGDGFFEFCYKNPKNQYFLVDIEDWYFMRPDNPQRLYNYLKAEILHKFLIGYMHGDNEYSHKTFWPENHYPKNKQYNEILNENLSKLSRFHSRIWNLLEKSYVSEWVGRKDFKFVKHFLKKSGFYRSKLLDFLYSEPSSNFIQYSQNFCQQLKFYQLDATKRLPFPDKYFDRVYSVSIVFKETPGIYEEALRLSKEDKVRDNYTSY